MRKQVEIRQKILKTNEEFAQANRDFFRREKLLCLNMISSPGSGKTTILAKTIKRLRETVRIGVIEGDVQTDFDAEKIRAMGAPAVQIETRGACHLNARQISQALDELPTDKLDVVFIENVGNLVCPSAFELGENGKVAVLSVAEGDDKPAKYPALFAKARAMLINKTDLLGPAGADFDIDRAEADARKVNKSIRAFPMSAKTGDGLEAWCNWLTEQVRATREP
jgi:hydrogenase nickel incorporation protein HypB